jgi:ankyrin repeat protein
LLKAGADIHQRHPKENTTVMFVAIRDATADAHMVRLLIKHGAKVNVADKGHWPLFLKACATEDIAVVRALIEAGANVNQGNWHGWTPLMAAGQTGSSEKAELLLKHGAKVNARTRRGWTALSEAKRAGHFDVVSLLTRAGGVDPVNAQPKTRKDRGKLKVDIKVLD